MHPVNDRSVHMSISEREPMTNDKQLCASPCFCDIRVTVYCSIQYQYSGSLACFCTVETSEETGDPT